MSMDMIDMNKLTMRDVFLGLMIVYVFLRIIGFICPFIVTLFCIIGLVHYYKTIAEKMDDFKQIYSLRIN